MPQPNDPIGPYVLIRKLGSGGFGDVWLAERRTVLLTSQVALKLPRVSEPDTDELRREAETWQRASGHPNIVPVLDADLYDGQVVIASEYIAGGTLADLLSRSDNPAADLDSIVRLMDGILAGLDHLHSAGIAHRDLKPDNVMLQAGIPRLTDFGLSRILSSRNLTENAVGTPRYMAPETFAGAYSAASDLWSAGAIFYEMLAGKPPFDSVDVFQVINAVRESEPAPLPDQVPDWLRPIVFRLLSRPLERRYSDARQALAALRSGTGNAPVAGPSRAVARNRSGESRRAPAARSEGGPASSNSGSGSAIDGADAIEMGIWTVELMGALRLRRDGRLADEQPTPRSGALLARLAFEPGKAFSRETLMEMLWPDTPIKKQRNNMSVELNRLRRCLALPGIPGEAILPGPDPLHLDPHYVESDVSRMSALAASARRSVTPAERIAVLQEAAALYRPELLREYDHSWIAGARASLDRLYLEIMEKLITDLGQAGEHDRAIETARVLVDGDELDEGRQGLLVFALVQAGRPCDAAAQFDSMRERWVRELGEPPGPRARKLGEEARRRCDAQPAIKITAPAHNGPALPQSFLPILGREKEIGDLNALVENPEVRLVTLTGTGGGGKTRLAIEVASYAAEPLSGAVWFAPLVDLTDRAMVTDSLRNLLGIAATPQTEAIGQITQVLSAQPSLLVLDNFEHLAEQEAGLIEELLSCAPSLTCLVTSRQSLQLPMEVIFDVPPLSVPDERREGASKHTGNLESNACIGLFMQRARRARPDFTLTAENGPTIAEICRRLDGIPLAIELAASWARMLTPADMVAQLNEILVSRDRSVAVHHRSLDAVIGGSFARLPAQTQRFLAGLSVFRGGWTADAARNVCEEPLALPLLGDLMDASLILSYESGATMRYRMLEPIREYLDQRVDQFGSRTELQQNHQSYFLEFAREAAQGLRGAEQAAWMERVDEDLPNLRAGLDAAPAAKQMLAMAWTQPYWTARGRLVEGRQRISNAIAALETVPEGERGSVLLAAGIMDWMAGEINSARSNLNASLAYCRGFGDERGMLKALANLAGISSVQGEFGDAIRDYELALSVARGLNDSYLIAGILGNLGTTCLQHSDPVEARRRFDEVLAVLEQNPNDILKADVLHNLADLEREEGDPWKALERIEDCLTLRKKLGDRRAFPRTLLLLGIIWTQQKQYGAAIHVFAAADSAFEATGEPVRSANNPESTPKLNEAYAALSATERTELWEHGHEMTAQENLDWAIANIRTCRAQAHREA